jgi:hypothetical protein
MDRLTSCPRHARRIKKCFKLNESAIAIELNENTVVRRDRRSQRLRSRTVVVHDFDLEYIQSMSGGTLTLTSWPARCYSNKISDIKGRFYNSGQDPSTVDSIRDCPSHTLRWLDLTDCS